MLVGESVRGRNRWRQIFAAALLVIGAGVWLGHDRIVRWYENHRAKQALGRAQAFVAQGDLANAMLSAQVAAQSDTFNLPAFRLAADILELVNSRDAVSSREQILQVSPDSEADRFACVRTALRFGDLQVAEHAFGGLTEAQRQSIEGLRATAMLRTAQHRAADAEVALAALVAKRGTDLAAKADLAALQLRSPDPLSRIQARAQLQAMAAQGGRAGHQALRELLRDAVARLSPADARKYAEQLVSSPEATFDDDIRLLNVHLAWPGMSSWRAQSVVQGRAIKSAGTAVQYANWLMLVGRPVDAVAWIEGLPPAFVIDPSVRATLVSALAAANRWDRVGREIEAGAWGKIEPQTSREALRIYALSPKQPTDAARERWNRLLAANAMRRDDLLVLVRLAGLWQWQDEEDAALRTFAVIAPDALWPLQRLATRYYQRKNTTALRDTWALWLKIHPEDAHARSDWILASLLTSSGQPSSAVINETRKLYEHDKHDAYAIAASAMVRWRENDLTGALRLMEQLSTEERSHGGRALYYGAMLAAAGKYVEARSYLALVVEARLLPEEIQLLNEARLAIDRKTGTVALAP